MSETKRQKASSQNTGARRRKKKPPAALNQKPVVATLSESEGPVTSGDVTVTDSQLRPYDENLLERSRTQWQFGDWESLAQLDRDTLQHHPDRAKLALLVAAGHLQQGNTSTARQFTRLAKEWGCSKELMSRILVAGVHNSLGQAAAVAGRREQALNHLHKSIAIGTPGGEARLLTPLRITQQLGQMQFSESAINHPILPDSAFHRPVIQECKPIPQQETALAPDADNYQVLAHIHQTLNPGFYLEIGVQRGKSLALAQCPAIGIDPVPQQRVALGEKSRVITTTSDEFFTFMADKQLPDPPDLVLIDGMPLLEYVLRDLNHSERRGHPATLIVVSNIYPQYPEQATRRRQGADWIGDIWKLPALMATHRPDLFTLGLDVADTGLLLITGLDPSNKVLEKHMVAMCKVQDSLTQPPAEIMVKAGSVPASHPAVANLLATLRQARKQSLSAPKLGERLQTIRRP